MRFILELIPLGYVFIFHMSASKLYEHIKDAGEFRLYDSIDDPLFWKRESRQGLGFA